MGVGEGEGVGEMRGVRGVRWMMGGDGEEGEEGEGDGLGCVCDEVG